MDFQFFSGNPVVIAEKMFPRLDLEVCPSHLSNQRSKNLENISINIAETKAKQQSYVPKAQPKFTFL